MDIKILNQILHIAFEKRVSDLHFEVDNPPFFRTRPVDPLKAAEPDPPGYGVYREQDNGTHNRTMPADFTELDASFALPNGGRFRGSIFRQRGHIGIVMRVIPPHVGTFEQLNLPPVLGEIATAPNGLILVTGSTGNGKSTTLASMIQYLNDTYNFNIITIEDPVEFLFTSSKSCIIQREVGWIRDFSTALRAALRMDPDVIMVGEMRDLETIDACIKAAETGHLVLSTLHTTGAASTINRLVGTFPPIPRR